MDEKSHKQSLLDALYEPYITCNACPLGKLGRTNVVFGEGNPNAKLMFIGEGPGEREDLLNRPFVGRTGNLLTKVMEAVGINRTDVYITNIVKCRPPNNRNPLPIESSRCINLLLLNQIAIIRPKTICLLGSIALHAVLDKNISISKARGKIFKKGAITFIPTYHPAYILRNNQQLETFFNDLKLAIESLHANKEI